jgi:hypothetical protein
MWLRRSPSISVLLLQELILADAFGKRSPGVLRALHELRATAKE